MAAKKAPKKSAARKSPAKSAASKSTSSKASAKSSKPASKPASKRASKAAGKASAKSAARKPAAKKKGGAATVPGISRIDQESTRTHGFFVRVGYHRTKEGAWRPKHRAFFGDAGHGGKEKAFKAAVKWLKDAQKK